MLHACLPFQELPFVSCLFNLSKWSGRFSRLNSGGHHQTGIVTTIMAGTDSSLCQGFGIPIVILNEASISACPLGPAILSLMRAAADVDGYPRHAPATCQCAASMQSLQALL